MLQSMQASDYNLGATPIDTEGLLKVLLAMRLDAVMVKNCVMGHLLSKHGAQHQVKLFVAMEKHIALYFSKWLLKNHPGFMRAFYASCARIKAIIRCVNHAKPCLSLP